MTPALKGKTALITGASGGIGRAMALRLGQAGARVAVHYGQNQQRALETVQAIESAGGSAFALGANLDDQVQRQALVEQLAQQFGEKLDILINNAGVGFVGDLAHTSEEDYTRVFDTNVKAIFFLTQALLPHLSAGGSIINLSSVVSTRAYPMCIAYAMSKAALESFTLSLAADLGPRRIRVNAIAPGATATDFLGDLSRCPDTLTALANAAAFNRLGQPDDIATLAEFLASPGSAWITGQVIQASGGMNL